MRIKRILLPTDLSKGADPAKDLALTLAKAHGAELQLFNAVVTHEHEFRQLNDLLSDFLKQVETDSGRALEGEASRLRELGYVVQARVGRGSSAYDAILQQIQSWPPDLIVMGTHSREGVGRWFLGSVAEKVVRHVPLPVITVRAAEGAAVSPRLERVLVPIDFSDNSHRAVAAARGLARGGEAPPTLLHVVLNPALSGVQPDKRVRLFEIDEGLPERIRERMVEWMEGEPFDAEIREADEVSICIIEAAVELDADIIVLGTRGRSGMEHFLLGSVAEKVIRQSAIPVLTVK